METYTFTKADLAVYRALLKLEQEEGQPFVTRRVAIAVESGQRPITLDCSLYRLERDGIIRREGRRGHGTIIEILHYFEVDD